MAESIVARDGAAVWSVEPGDGGAREERLDSRRLDDEEPTTAEMLTSEILEFRETLAARTGGRRARLGVGRLD